jgi:hypothetical protein
MRFALLQMGAMDFLPDCVKINRMGLQPGLVTPANTFKYIAFPD